MQKVILINPKMFNFHSVLGKIHNNGESIFDMSLDLDAMGIKSSRTKDSVSTRLVSDYIQGEKLPGPTKEKLKNSKEINLGQGFEELYESPYFRNMKHQFEVEGNLSTSIVQKFIDEYKKEISDGDSISIWEFTSIIHEKGGNYKNIAAFIRTLIEVMNNHNLFVYSHFYKQERIAQLNQYRSESIASNIYMDSYLECLQQAARLFQEYLTALGRINFGTMYMKCSSSSLKFLFLRILLGQDINEFPSSDSKFKKTIESIYKIDELPDHQLIGQGNLEKILINHLNEILVKVDDFYLKRTDNTVNLLNQLKINKTKIEICADTFINVIRRRDYKMLLDPSNRNYLQEFKAISDQWKQDYANVISHNFIDYCERYVSVKEDEKAEIREEALQQTADFYNKNENDAYITKTLSFRIEQLHQLEIDLFNRL
ncbi:hypothetical protein [Leuconostoc mesenteroides]|uniref:hypothetical protein n=1 Tax=Leuconostoc mesenteroides TaxID=1245 RepID=UPI001CC08731|nr:hypothetical protein [Leuconostoc mesenteroides]MBZ1502368.1 hypothetical protein [Leuconostoc mesenteroides]